MPRFFVTAGNIFGGIAYIKGKDAEHIRVLRLREGETVTVCDGRGTDYVCRVKDVASGETQAEVLSMEPSAGEADVECTVFAAWPKGDKAELIVQKAVELGADKIVFYPCVRCVSRPDTDTALKKRDRLEKIAEEAAKQCGRGILPRVGVSFTFADMLNDAAASDLCLMFYEEGGQALTKIFGERDKPGSVSIITGPEGGFERSEIEQAEKRGAVTATLGRRILRCETAPQTALTAVMLLTGNLE